MNPQDLYRIWRDLYQRRWLAIGVGAATMLVVGLGCLFLPRYYRASATLLPAETALNRPLFPGQGSVSSPGQGSSASALALRDEMMATLVELAKLPDVRSAALKAVGLDMSLNDMEDALRVERGRGRLILVTATTRSPRTSVDLANAIAHEFAAWYRAEASKQAKSRLRFKERQLQVAEKELEVLKRELQTMKGQEAEAALPPGSEANPFLIEFYRLRSHQEATRSELQATEGRIASIRAQLQQLSPTRETQVSSSDNPVTKQLQDELARLQKELVAAQSRYTEKHRRVQELKAQVADVEARLERETSRMVTRRTVEPNPVYRQLQDRLVDLAADRAALQARLSSVAAAMAENEQRATRLADSSVVLMAKERDFQRAQETVDRLKRELDQARTDETLTSSEHEIGVVGPARSASGPVIKSGPSLAQLLVLGFLLSLALGVGSALGVAFLDSRIQRREDLGKALELPVPAVIPALPDSTGGAALARITELEPLSAYAEAYRFLRADIVYGHQGEPLKVLLVATARPGQGGSTTAANLAISLAEIGRRVVLVDADMRRPVLHTFFGESNEAGLATLLSNGAADPAQALRQTGMETLLLLPAGPAVENPAALLSSDRMRRLIMQLREHSDHVVIDTPSAATFADATMLSPLVDGVILVMRANQALGDPERRTREMFAKVGANVVGAVLNHVRPEDAESFTYHHHYYGTRYRSPDNPQGPREGGGGGGSGAAVAEPEPRAQKDPADRATAAIRAVSAPGPRDGGARVEQPAPRRTRAEVWHRHRGLRAAVAAAVAVGLLVTGGWLTRQRVWRAAPAAGPPAAGAPRPVAGVRVEALIKNGTSVRVEQDGKLLYEGVLAGLQVWTAERELVVWAAQPWLVEITKDGRYLGPMGHQGDEPVSRRYAPEGGEE